MQLYVITVVLQYLGSILGSCNFNREYSKLIVLYSNFTVLERKDMMEAIKDL